MYLVDPAACFALQTRSLRLFLHAGEPSRIATGLASQAFFSASAGLEGPTSSLLRRAERVARAGRHLATASSPVLETPVGSDNLRG